MPNPKFFSVLDANHGFWQIQLNGDSSNLCTFNTPFGRYRFKQLPFGVSSAPEVFQKCIAQKLEDLEGVNVMDDILVWGVDKEHDKRLRQLLDRIRSINLKLNKDVQDWYDRDTLYWTCSECRGPEAGPREGQSNNRHATTT